MLLSLEAATFRGYVAITARSELLELVRSAEIHHTHQWPWESIFLSFPYAPCAISGDHTNRSRTRPYPIAYPIAYPIYDPIYDPMSYPIRPDIVPDVTNPPPLYTNPS